MRLDTVKQRSWRLARSMLPPPAKALLRRTLPARWLPQEAFNRACLRYIGVPDGMRPTPLQEMHLSYALSTNERGASGAQVIKQFTEVEGSRCLDIGCAYGGFLVGLARLGARELVGIDVNERLLELAQVNLQESGVEAKLKLVDVQDRAAVASLGEFNIVISNDVLEHVQELPLAIENTCRLTAKNGILYAVIPNKYYVRYLLTDGHYQLPGITLLSHADAERYYEIASLGGGYDIDHYRTLTYYLHHLGQNRMSVELLKNGLAFDDLNQLADEFEQVREFFETFSNPSLPANIVAKIVKRARVVYTTFRGLKERYERACSRDAKEAARLADKIVVRYGMWSWHVIARRVRD